VRVGGDDFGPAAIAWGDVLGSVAFVRTNTPAAGSEHPRTRPQAFRRRHLTRGLAMGYQGQSAASLSRGPAGPKKMPTSGQYSWPTVGFGVAQLVDHSSRLCAKQDRVLAHHQRGNTHGPGVLADPVDLRSRKDDTGTIGCPASPEPVELGRLRRGETLVTIHNASLGFEARRLSSRWITTRSPKTHCGQHLPVATPR
jgi:hypothetical protein